MNAGIANRKDFKEFLARYVLLAIAINQLREQRSILALSL